MDNQISTPVIPLLAKMEYRQTAENLKEILAHRDFSRKIYFRRKHKVLYISLLILIFYFLLNQLNLFVRYEHVNMIVHAVLSSFTLYPLLILLFIHLFNPGCTWFKRDRFSKKINKDAQVNNLHQIGVFVDGLLIKTPQFLQFVPWSALKIFEMDKYIEIEISPYQLEARRNNPNILTTLFIPKDKFVRQKFFIDLAKNQCFYHDMTVAS